MFAPKPRNTALLLQCGTSVLVHVIDNCVHQKALRDPSLPATRERYLGYAGKSVIIGLR